MPHRTPDYFRKEKANIWTHGLGLLFAVLAMPFLIFAAVQNGSEAAIVGALVFAFSFTILFLASTVFHASHEPKIRNKLRVFDHISIYYLIAGTYTPFILIFMWNSKGMTVLAALWILSLIGTVFKLWFTGKYDYLSTGVYLFMGWMLIFIANDFFSAVPLSCMWWIIIGGVFYTTGVIFYIKEWFFHHHAVWHVFVLIAAISHYIAVYISVLQ